MSKVLGSMRQRGVSLIGLLFWVVVLGIAGLVVAQTIPTYVEFMAVQNAVNKAKDSPSVNEARQAFDKYASVEGISSITGSDLEIYKANGDRTVISFKYSREVPLAGPVSLLIKYSGESK
ncbi:MAG: hypothetical protein RLZZ271_645 [Pseudomonadota bacterium]|jgi:Tfp pilus assembly protein PilE